MDVAIVAPCPIPYVRGGAENLWRALQDHLNEETSHQAEIIKLATREHGFWDLIASYRAFSELDVHEFDVVVSGKYPAWMVGHGHHVVYMLHPLRGLYETYHYFNLPDSLTEPPAPVAELLDYCDGHSGRRDALPEFFERMAGLHARRDALPAELFAFPGPLIRALVHWLDGVARAGAARFGAISHTVAGRPDYFPDGVNVFVAHPPTTVQRAPGGRRGDYVFTVGRMDAIKRTDLLIAAMAQVTSGATLRIAGSGPEEARLRELAAANPRVRFEGRVSEAELTALYANARAVAFCAYDEDFGLVVLEGMQSARPIITCRDSGGPTELVEDGRNGLVVEPDAAALAQAIDRLWARRNDWRRMGRAALERAREVSWTPVIAELEAVAAT